MLEDEEEEWGDKDLVLEQCSRFTFDLPPLLFWPDLVTDDLNLLY